MATCFEFSISEVEDPEMPDKIEAMFYKKLKPRNNLEDGTKLSDFEVSKVEMETLKFVDCKIHKRVTALLGSGDPICKRITEFSQNAADTTFHYLGGHTTGGWGEGFKMACAQLLALGVKVHIYVMPCNKKESDVMTDIQIRDSSVVISNLHPSKHFNESAMYIGNSDKTPMTAQRVKFDMTEQMDMLMSSAMSSCGNSKSILSCAVGNSWVTSARLDFSGVEVNNRYTLHM